MHKVIVMGQSVDDSRLAIVDLPREFVDFCHENGLEPTELINAFVAKACIARKKSVFCRSFFSDPEHAEQFLRPARAELAS